MSELKGALSNVTVAIFIGVIVLATYFVAQRYIIPFAWAGIIVIALWPWYQRWLRLWGGRRHWAALTITLVIALVIIIPLAWIFLVLAKEAQHASDFLTQHNQTGIVAPLWLAHMPFIGAKVMAFWQANLNQPDFLHHVSLLLSQHYQSFHHYARLLSAKTLYHSVGIGFSLLALFFFFRDGQAISEMIEAIGQQVLPMHWGRYFSDLAQSIRGVVNGTVLTGFGVGCVMSVGYVFTSLPVPALFGLLTAVLAMIPFGMVVVLLVVVLTLLVQGSYIAALIMLILGMVVSFVSDHIIKPQLIGHAIKLPFLMILIGIIGGIEHLGIIGLFLGPIIMVLFYQLLREYATMRPKPMGW